MPSPARDRPRLGLRRLALLCAALLSCTTLRTPVSTISGAVPVHEGVPEPQLELWVESNKPLSPEESERYRSDARAALEKALAGRTQPDDQGQLMVIRAQGVTRTSGHRSDQKAAVAGMVVGAVVVVAAVVIAFVAGGKSSHGGGGHARVPSAAAPRAGRGGSAVARSGGAALPAPRFAAPAPRVARPFPAVPAPHRVPVAPAPARPFAPAPWPHPAPGPSVEVGVGFWWAIPYAEPEPQAFVSELPPAPPPPEAPLQDWEEEPPPDATAAGPLEVPPPEPFPIEDRGFFDGDRLVLEAVVLDRTTGAELWTKRVSRKADPRDARAVKEAVDALLSDGGWEAAPAAR